MMLSKIIISITIFVYICIRSSESIHAKDCNTDDEFLKAVEDYKNEKKIPIVITTNSSMDYDKEHIEKPLKLHKYRIYIRVIVDGNQCPLTINYLLTEQNYSSVFMMIHNHLYIGGWNPLGLTSLEKYLIQFRRKRSMKNGVREKSVTEDMRERIANRNRMAANQMEGPSQRLSRSQSGSPLLETRPTRKSTSPQPVDFMNIQQERRPLRSWEVPQSSNHRGKQAKSTSLEYDPNTLQIFETQKQMQQVKTNRRTDKSKWGLSLNLSLPNFKKKKPPS